MNYKTSFSDKNMKRKKKIKEMSIRKYLKKKKKKKKRIHFPFLLTTFLEKYIHNIWY